MRQSNTLLNEGMRLVSSIQKRMLTVQCHWRRMHKLQ